MLFNERAEIILQQVQLQSTVRVQELSELLQVSQDTVRRDLRAMEKRGAIVKYTAIANLDEEEDECVEALIEVKIAPRSGSGFDGVAEELAQHKEVKTLYLMSGAYDLLVIVEAGSIKSVSRFVSECISTFDCVLSTATHFILKKYKIEGALTVGRDKKRRLPVQA